VTSVVVTHDMKSAYRVADRIAMLYEGGIRFVGTPDEIQRAEDPVVRGFIEGRPELARRRDMTRRNEVMVGLVVIAGILLIVFGTIWLRGIASAARRSRRSRPLPRGRPAADGQQGQVPRRAHRPRRVIELEPTGAAVIVTMSIAATCGCRRIRWSCSRRVHVRRLAGRDRVPAAVPHYDYAESLNRMCCPATRCRTCRG
jgi:hypothetical protein